MKKIRRRAFMISIFVTLLLLVFTTVHTMAATGLRVVSSNPNTNDRIISIDEDITVVFNKNIKNGSGFSNITLRNLNNISIPITCRVNGQTLSISPNDSLQFGQFYMVTIPYNAVMDDDGNPINEDFNLIIVTEGDYISPRIESIVPADQAREVDTNSTISVKFSEKIRAGSEIEGIELIYGNNQRIPLNIGISGDTLTIKPLIELQYNTTYFIIVPYNSVVDLSGNKLYGTELMFFTTKSIPSELKVDMSKPSKDAKYISINNPIQIFYNENIVGDNGLQNITVKDESGNIPISILINNKIIYITPKNSLNFAYDTTYTVTIPSGAVKGVSGATTKESYSFRFTTEAQIQSPKITDASPQNGVTDSAVNSTIKVTFSENIKQGETINDISLKDEEGNVIKVDLSINNNVLNIRPKTLLDYNTTYNYMIPYGAVTNYSNKPLKQQYEFKFKTDIERFNPLISKSYPVDGALNTTVDGGVTIIFNEEIKKDKNFDYITLRDINYNELPIVRELSDKTLKITPVNSLNLAYNTKYIVTIPYGAVKDVWDNRFVNSSSISFTTGFERFSPIIKNFKPSNGSSDVKIDAAIEITYNDKMLKGDNFNEIVLKDSQDNKVEYNIDIKDDKIILKPVRKLENNTSYSLLLPVGGVKDYWGGVSKNDFILEFKTEKEKVPPVLNNTVPTNKSRNIDINSELKIAFNENILPGKTFKKITLTNGNMKNVPYTAEVNKNILIIKPVNPLEEITSYTLRIPFDAITDRSENTLIEDGILNFMTKPSEKNKDSLAVNDVKLNANNSSITIAFNKNITYGSNIRRVLLKDQKGKTVSLRFGVKGNALTLTLSTKLTSGYRYTLIIPGAGVKDNQGKNMINQYSYSFNAK